MNIVNLVWTVANGHLWVVRSVQKNTTHNGVISTRLYEQSKRAFGNRTNLMTVEAWCGPLQTTTYFQYVVFYRTLRTTGGYNETCGFG
jgi:hypothetical protein